MAPAPTIAIFIGRYVATSCYERRFERVRCTHAATLKSYNDELCEFDTAGRGWARMSKGRADHDVLFEVAGVPFVARTPEFARRDVPTLLVVGAADDKEAIVEPAAAMSSRAQVKPSATTT